MKSFKIQNIKDSYSRLFLSLELDFMTSNNVFVHFHMKNKRINNFNTFLKWFQHGERENASKKFKKYIHFS